MHKPSTVLIVDDSDKNRQFMRELIQHSLVNCQIDQAENGEIAVQLVNQRIKQTKASFPLIIMDFQMPILNGAQATEQIRTLEQQAGIKQPSIIVTWSAALTTPFPLADDCLVKYTNKQEVAAMLACYLLKK